MVAKCYQYASNMLSKYHQHATKTEEHVVATLSIKGFPDKLYGELQDDADRHHRSLSGHVTFLLEWAIQQQERPSLQQIRGLGQELWAEAEGRPAQDVGTSVQRRSDGWKEDEVQGAGSERAVPDDGE